MWGDQLERLIDHMGGTYGRKLAWENTNFLNVLYGRLEKAIGSGFKRMSRLVISNLKIVSRRFLPLHMLETWLWRRLIQKLGRGGNNWNVNVIRNPND